MPLPEHTKIDYNECYALLILTDLFPKRYMGLQIQDKPDLQSENLGVEVTIACDEIHQEACNNWVKAYYTNDEKKRTRAIERMKQLGVEYTGGIQAWPGRVPTIKYLIQAVSNKVCKYLAGGYKNYDEMELFVFYDMWMTEKLIEESKDYFSRENVYSIFEKIYVLEEGNYLHIFEKKDYHMYTITDGYERSIRAVQIIKQAEKL